jgi:predicted metal-dependent phosphoesterase TrpH
MKMAYLKADLHTHAQEDRFHTLPYTSKDLVKQAKKLGYNVIALTFHRKVFEGPRFKEVEAYAKRLGVLLIPGCEANIEGKDVLIYNITESERKKIKTLRDLRKWKIDALHNGREVLVIAPHPYHVTAGVIGKYCLGRKLVKNIDIFDAIEYSFFYLKRYNKNKKAVKIAKRYCKPLVGNGDIHTLENLNFTYTLINSKKTVSDVIHAIKKGHVKIVSRPLTVKHVIKMAYLHSFKLRA